MTRVQAISAEDVEVAAEAIETGLLKQSVESYGRIRLTLFVPILLVCLLVAGEASASVTFAIGAVQGIVAHLLARSNDNLGKALEADSGVARAIRMKTGFIALSGILWGLALWPIGIRMATGVGSLFVLLTIIVAVSLSAIMLSSVRVFSYAIMIGYVSSALPICLYFSDAIGFMPAISTIAFGPAVIWLSRAFAAQTRKSMSSELQNALLARHLQSALDTAEYLSQHDSLTALLNRRAFEREAAAFRGKADAVEPAQIILFDLDHFKDINDGHGHQAGDAVLRTVAETLKTVLGGPLPDSFTQVWTSRWGGEEFIVMLAGATPHSAWAMAEIMRSAVSCAENPDWPEGMRLTASFGISQWHEAEPLHEAIARADEAMYRAKQRGRNCVEQARAGERRRIRGRGAPLVARR